MATLFSPVQANVVSEYDDILFTGIFLYKPDYSYNLSKLDKFVETGSVIILDEYSDLVALGLDNTEINMDDFSFQSPYYIYKSHYNSELGVVIYEIIDSLVFTDVSGDVNFTDDFFSLNKNAEGAWENISGLSVNLVLPAKFEEITINVQLKTLTINFEVDLNESLVNFMSQLGYEEGGITEINNVNTFGTKTVTLIFTKDNTELWLSSGMGGQTWGDVTEPNETVITLMIQEPDQEQGMNTTQETANHDMKKLLEYLNISPEAWDNAESNKYSIPDIVLKPTVEIDGEEFDWTSAMKTELEWLADNHIISSLTEDKIDKISESVIPGVEIFISNESYFREPISIEFVENDAGDTLASGALSIFFNTAMDDIAENPDKNGPEDLYQFYLRQAVGGIITIIAIGTFSYTRLKRRNILDNLNRKNIFEYIRAYPGIHFKKLLRDLNFKPGAMSYHLNVLEKGEYIKSIQDGNFRRFYLYGAKSDLKIALTSIQLRILSVVDDRPGISQTKISELIGSNRMLVNYHIKILNDADLLSLEKDGRKSQVYTTSNAEIYLS